MKVNYKYISLLLAFFLSLNTSLAQECFNLNFSDCASLNNTVTVDANTANALWTVTDPLGNTIVGPFHYSNNQTITFNEVGTYTFLVQQTATNCTGIETFEVIIHNQSLNITNTDIIACEGEIVTLGNYLTTINNTTGNPLTYEWNTNLGTLYGLDPSYTIPNSNESILLTVTDATGCQANATLNVQSTSNNIGTPNYTISEIIIPSCESEEIDFAVSNPNPLLFSYSWSMQGNTYSGDNITSTVFPAATNPGSIPLSLNVTEISSGCTISFNDTITSIGLSGGAAFGTNNIPLCIDSASTFWPEDGVKPILEMGPKDTIFWTINCDDTSAALNTIWTNADLSLNNQLHPYDPFGNPNGISAFQHFFEENSCDCDNGEYLVRIDIVPYCASPSWFSTGKKVNDPIVAGVNLPSPLCQYEAANLINTSSAGCDGSSFDNNETYLYYNWDFGNCVQLMDSAIATSTDPFPNINYAYPEPGIYDVTLSASSFCGDSDTTGSITVYPEPNVSWNASNICLGEVTQFTDLSFASTATTNNLSCGLTITVPAGGLINEWLWDFGDGNTSTLQNPTHEYAGTGNYTVTLTVTDSNGCSNSYTDTINMLALPNPFFTSTNSCSGNPNTIINESTTGDNPITIWAWNFGTGAASNSNTQNPGNVLFTADCDTLSNADGISYFPITLYAEDAAGCHASYTDSAQVFCTPATSFNAPPVCEGFSTLFINTSSIQYGMQFEWDFGDGSTSTAINPQHTYANCGDYLVSLNVSDSNQLCTDVTSSMVTVYCPPSVNNLSTQASSCLGDSLLFNTSYTEGDGVVDQWLWDFGDNTYALNSSNSLYHQYDTCHTNNLFTASYSVIDEYGCADTEYTNFELYCPPNILNLLGENNCFGSSTNFNSVVSAGSNNSLQYDWYYGDGSNELNIGGNTVHTYLDTGNFVVTLNVSDGNSCSSNSSTSIRTYPNPTATISSLNNCLGEASLFNSNITLGDGTITSWMWDFGDGTSIDNNANPISHSYSSCGEQFISLTLTDDILDDQGNYCQSTNYDTLEVYCLPTVLFSADDVCIGNSTNFTDFSNTSNDSITSWVWDFGDGNSISTNNNQINHLYDSCGTYTVTLSVFDNLGCSSTDSIEIIVYCDSYSEINVIQQSSCAPFIINNSIVFINDIDPSTTYTWELIDSQGNSSSTNGADIPNHTISQESDTLLVILTTYNNNNCENAIDSILFTTIEDPTAAFTTDSIGCHPFTPSITNNSSLGTSSLWTVFIDGTVFDSSTQNAPSLLLTNTSSSVDSNYIIQLIATGGTGCSDTLSHSVSVQSSPTANFSIPNSCGGDSTLLLNTSLGNSLSYDWSSNNGASLSNNTSTNPVVYFPDNQTGVDINYDIQLVVSNNLGCEDSITIAATTHSRPIANFNMDTEYCGNIIVFSNNTSSYADTYLWSVDGSASISNINNPNPAFSFPENNTQDSIIYNIQLIASNAFSCVDTSLQLATSYPTPTSEFLTSTIDSCGPLTVNFQNTSNPYNGEDINSMSFLWMVDGVTQSNTLDYTHTYFNNGSTDSTYQTQLIAYSMHGCSSTSSTEIIVRPNQQTNQTITLCDNESITVGGNIYNNPGIYTDTLASMHACDSIVITEVIVFPTYDLSTQSTICNGESITVGNNIYSSPGSYTDSLISVNACDSVINTTLFVLPTFNTHRWDTICNGENISVGLSNYSLSGDYIDTLLAINNCDSIVNTHLIVKPSFLVTQSFSICDYDSITIGASTYTSEGTFSDTLIAQNGCDSIVLTTINFLPNPIAEINALSPLFNCAPFTIDNTVIEATEYPSINDSLFWAVLNGLGDTLTSSSNTPPTHLMNNDNDSVTIVLLAYNQHSCTTDTAQVTFYTISDPVSSFSLSENIGCNPFTTAISNNSTANTNYQWTVWNDGQITDNSANENPNFILSNSSYTQDSTYNIELIVTAGTGCSDTSSQNMLVHPQPFADFSLLPPNACADTTLLSANNSLGTGTSYQWNANLGATISDNTSYAPLFSFPDNQSGVDSNYTIELIVQNEHLCLDSSTVNTTIYSRPISSFTIANEACGNSTLSPINNSSFASQYIWSADAGVTISDETSNSPLFTFPENSTSDSIIYQIQLATINDQNCQDSSSQSVTIYPNPSINFTASETDSCGPLTVSFNNTSSANNGESINSMSFNWSVDGLTFSTNQDAIHTLNNTGASDSTYQITLLGSSSHGCIDSNNTDITVYPNPIAFFELINGNNNTNCAPFNISENIIELTDFNDANDNYEWIYLDQNGNILATNFSNTPPAYLMENDADTLNALLIANNTHNCVADTFSMQFVTIPDPVATFTISNSSGCDSLTTTISYTGTTGVNYLWNFDDTGINSNSNTANNEGPHTITYPNPWDNDTSYTVKLLVGDLSSGCVDSSSQSILVHPSPEAYFTATEVCEGSPTLFNDVSTPTNFNITNWLWDFDDLGNTDNSINPNYIFSNYGTYNTCLSVTDLNNCSNTYCDTVIVRPNPIADFLVSHTCAPDFLCAGEDIHFGNTSVLPALGGDLDSALWLVNDALVQAADADSIFTTILSSGQHSITLNSITEYGCEDSYTDSFTVVETPTAHFTASSDSICFGDSLFIIANNSNGYILQYEWSIYGNENDTLFNWVSSANTPPSLPILPQGLNDTTYTLSLSTANCCGNTSHQETVLVKPQPIVGFGLSDSIICSQANLCLMFEPYIYGATDSIIVHFGDGSSSTVHPDTVPPTNWDVLCHQYYGDTISFLDTTYYISAIGYNSCGTDTFRSKIVVTPNEIVSFFTTNLWFDTASCESLNTSFIENSFAPLGSNVSWCFDWDTSTNSCNQPLYLPYQLGDTISHSYTEAGYYTVMHAINDGVCSFDTSYSDLLVVYPNPQASFTPTNACLFDTLTFINNSSIDSAIVNPLTTIAGYRWIVDGIVVDSTSIHLSYSFNSPGAHTISLEAISDRGCIDITTHEILIYELPVAAFITDSVCFGDYTLFQDNSYSIESNTNIVNWNWDFGDNATLNGLISNPSHLYGSASNYLSTLSVIDNFGCSNSFSDWVNIRSNPTADFTVDTICLGNSSEFISLSSEGSGLITNYIWDFNTDGTIDASLATVNTTANYASCGDYLTTLEIVDEFTCRDTIAKWAKVWCPPIVNFSSSTVCDGDSTTFLNNSIAVDADSISSYLWNFGDSFSNPIFNISTTEQTQHLYDTCGSFTTTLILADNLGCIASDSITTAVICLPTAAFTATSVCEGTVSNFTDLSLDSSAYPITNWNWEITGSGSFLNSSSNNQYPSYLFDSCGVYPVMLHVAQSSTQYGCADSLVSFIEVYCNPDAGFTTDTICPSTPIAFTDTSLSGSAPIVAWWWDFGLAALPQNANTNNPSSTFNSPGTWPITLTVTDENGCNDTGVQQIDVDSLPIIDFLFNNVCANEIISFVDLTEETSNSLQSWYWDFGNGFSSNVQNTQHLYQVDPYLGELFTVTLTVNDSKGCQNSLSQTAEVHPIPNVTYFIADQCENNMPLTLIDQTTLSNGSGLSDYLVNPVTFNWNGYNTYLNLPIENYPFTPSPLFADTFSSSLSVSTNFGCSNTGTNSTIVFPAPTVNFNYSLTPFPSCGFDVNIFLDGQLSDDISGNGFYWELEWDPANLVTEENFNSTIPQPGGYNITLNGTNLYGCSASVSDSITIYPNPVANFFATPTYGCELLEVTFIDTSYLNSNQLLPSSHITDWIWNFGNGEQASGEGPHIVNYSSENGTEASTFDVSLTIVSDGNCTNTIELQDYITVLPSPIPIITTPVFEFTSPIPHGEFLFSGDSSTFSGGATATTPPFNYAWYVNDAFVGEGQNLQYQFPSNSTYLEEPYKLCLEMYGMNECVAESCIDLTVAFFKGLFIPNALTPSAGSGDVRLFLPKGKSLKLYELEIYDRWGSLIWKTEAINTEDGSPAVGWTGTNYKGIAVPQGVYVWKIRAQFANGEWWEGTDNYQKTGTITLIR